MTVFPGFGGQEFMGEVMAKVGEVRRAATRQGLALDVQVDGGIDERTAGLATAAGANVLVAGSAVFGHERPWERVEAIRRAAVAAVPPDRRFEPIPPAPG